MLKVTKQNDEITVYLNGEVHVEDAFELREELIRHIQEGWGTIIIDMKDLTYIDSTGMGVLVAIHKKAANIGGNVFLKNLNAPIKELFELALLNKVFKIL